MREIIVFLVLGEQVAQHQEEVDVVLTCLVGGNVYKKIMLGYERTHFKHALAEFFKYRKNFLECIRLAERRQCEILDLAYALARDAVGLADRLKSHFLGLGAESIALGDDILRTLRK